MRQFGGIVALRFFESLLKVGEALFEIFLAHGLKVHRVCVMDTVSVIWIIISTLPAGAEPRKAVVPRPAALQV
jgi:hypothetical protein